MRPLSSTDVVNGDFDVVFDDDDDDDDGYPAYSHQSYSHQVGICHNDEGWEYDTVKFPPYPCIMISIVMRGGGVCGQTRQVEPLRHPPDTP